MSTHSLEAAAVFTHLHQLNIQLYTQQDISLKTVIQQEAVAVFALLEQTRELFDALNKAHEITQAKKTKAEVLKSELILDLERSLDIQLNAQASEKVRIDEIIKNISKLKGPARESAFAKQTSLQIILVELKAFDEQEFIYLNARNKICNEWNAIVDKINSGFIQELSSQYPLKKIVPTQNIPAQLTELHEQAKQIIKRPEVIDDQAIKTMITSMQHYQKLRQEALKYKGKDVFNNGKNLSESKDVRFNSIERVVDYFKILAKQAYNPEDYVRGLRLLGHEINKIKTETSNYKPLLEEAKKILVERLRHDKNSVVQNTLDTLLVNQLKTTLHSILIRYAVNRQKSLLRRLPDALSPDALMQR